jgi:hypothetical protein
MSYWEPEEDYFEVDENFEFNTGINKLLEGEVEKRLAERVEGYEMALERDKKSQQEIRDLKSDIRELENQLSRSEKSFKSEGKDEALRELLGGFKLGDEVWFVKSHYKREECSVCSGDKKVIVEFKGEEMKVDCPGCKGYGSNGNTTKSVERGFIKEIEIHTWASGKQFNLSMYVDPTSYRSNDSMNLRKDNIFRTKEECEASL